VIGQSKYPVIGRLGNPMFGKQSAVFTDHPITGSPDHPMVLRSPDHRMVFRCRRQQGYILLTLILMVALVLIAMAAVLPSITGQLRRDREVELIHRGAQYARAIKRYYKKAGNYPATIDQLASTNNIRFLRKRYKDPVAGKDFRLLHVGEVQLTLGAGGLQPVVTGGTQSGVFGGSSSSGVAQRPSGQPSSSATPSSGTFGTPIQSNSASAPNPSGPTDAQGGTQAAVPAAPAGSTSQDSSSAAAQASSQSGSQGSSSQGSSQGAAPGSSQSSSPFVSVSQMTGNKGPTFGGGPIIGVASTSEKRSFHIFNKKDHYNDWAFVYDPNSDRGGLIKGPYNGPPKFGTGQVPGAVSPGQTQSGTSGSSSSTPTQTPFGSPFSQSPSSTSPSTSPFGQSPSTQQGTH
jgi:type II secretory pathway pseudopilin PulG